MQRPDGTIADLLSNVGTGGGDVGDEKRRVEAELKRLDAEEVEIAALDVQRVYRREVLHGRMRDCAVWTSPGAHSWRRCGCTR